MIKKIRTFLLLTFLLTSFSSTADEMETADYSGNLEKLVQYFQNFGYYFGYNLNNEVDLGTLSPAATQLINYSSSSTTGSLQKVLEQYAYFTLFGALPVNALYATFTDNNYASLDSWANATFANDTANIPIYISGLDQPTAQADPVSQQVLNIVATPDATMCTNGVSSSCAIGSSSCLSQNSVMQFVLSDILQDGILPSTGQYLNYANNYQKYLGSLNTNTLIAPLLYSTSNSNSENSSSQNASSGLPTGNQELQAGNFIRYAIGTLTEMPSITYDNYYALWQAAYPNGDETCTSANDPSSVLAARDLLESYFTSMRVFAARSSVAVSNLYYIFSRRVKQTKGTGSNAQSSSQALSEFQMATWRINNPQNNIGNQWVDQINQATSATVQKEIAILLSEINYQMYLSRQQQERLLLTNTMLLLQGLAMGKPTPPSATDAGGTTTTTTTSQ